MKRSYFINRLIVLRTNVRAILGNKLCLPKIFFQLSQKRRLSAKEAEQGDLLIERAISLVSEEFEKMIQELKEEDPHSK